MSASDPKVSVIILNLNSYEVTRDCLLSLEKLDCSDFDVILVDNGSTDSSGDQLKADFPAVHLLKTGANLGFTGGNNVGIREALGRGSEYLLLLNNDTMVAPDFLRLLLDEIESDPKIGMANPKILFAQPANQIWYGGGDYIPWRAFPHIFGLWERDKGQYDQKREISFATGCALLVRAEVVRRIGLLDEIFFLSFEDVDWSVRALGAGYRAVYVPQAVVWHKDSFDTKKNLGLARRAFYNMRNTVLCARRYLPLRKSPWFVFSLAKYVVYHTLESLMAADFARAVAYYRGVWTGCRTAMPARNP